MRPRSSGASCGLFVALLLTAVCLRPASAQIADVTGLWNITLVDFFTGPLQFQIYVVQDGTALDFDEGHGTIDPVTGSFTTSVVRTCPPPFGGTETVIRQGTFTADGSSLTGTWEDVGISTMHCVDFTFTMTGVRERLIECGNGIVEPTEVCDGGPCCDATCDVDLCATTTTSSTTTTTTTTTTSTTTTTLPPDLLSATKIELSDGTTPARKRLVVTSKDRTLRLGPFAGPDGDPTIHGGSLRVRTATGDVTYPLPAANWAQQGPSGYRYSDPRLVAGPVASVKVKQTRSLGVTAKGALLAHSLATDPRPVEIVVTLGSRKACLAGGGTETLKPGLRYTAKAAPAPAACLP